MQEFETRPSRSDTRSISIDVPIEEAFEFVADPMNLPSWAVGFCRSIRRDADERWIASTGAGDLGIRFVTRRDCGVIDFHMSPAPGIEIVAHSRFVPNNAGVDYTFTQRQAPGMTDELFDAQVRALTEELHVLRAVLQARHACPVR